MRKFWLSVWEILEVVLISAVTVFIIRTFLAQPFLVSGASMEPNFQHGNYLIIDEITYRFREPERSEVVVFRYPKDLSVFFIKRIIGLPGERVVVRGGNVVVYKNGKEILRESDTSGSIDVILGDNQYFVLGDNRYNSFDSRNWGPISRKEIIGLARLRVFPINEFEIISN
jgi:signal peptidase I